MATCTYEVNKTSEKVVLVTGGTGLVGMGLLAAVKENLHEEWVSSHRWIFLSSKDCDLTNSKSTETCFSYFFPKYVVHLAARVGGLFANMDRPVSFCRDNLIMNDNVLKESNRVGAKVVSCLSTCIFPDIVTYPIDEKMVHSGPPHHSNAGYAYAKRMIDVLNRCYVKEHGAKFTSVIPTNVYGPHDNFSLTNSHVIPGLIHKCYLAKKRGEAFVVAGTGVPLRQFIHSYDLGRLILWALENYDSPEPIILSVDPSDEVSILEIATLIAKAMEFDGPMLFDDTKADGQFKKTANNSKLRSFLPDYLFKNIEIGIKETVDWFLSHLEEVRK